MRRRGLLALPAPDPALEGAGPLVLLGILLFLVTASLPGWLGWSEALKGAGASGQALVQVAAWAMAALPLLVGTARLRRGRASLGIGVERLGGASLAAGGAIWVAGLLVWLPLFALYGGLLHALGVANEPQPIYQQLALDLTAGRPDPVLILLVCLVLPLGEEFFFRGVLHGLFRGIVPRRAAIGLAAALFALLHGPWTVVFPVFLLGLLFGYARERTGSVWGAWAAHALHNSMAVALAPTMIHLYDRVEPALHFLT